ncbi:hypothetical protein MAG26fr_orf026 [Klebsiella phage vB_KpnS_MAG26fr]|nr:hypothetical protein MAG26fr_orf026 [Klebsiella phage vB_KpnS_MAG26fr]
MIKYITDPNTIREICVDIMKAGVIPDAFNITSYLNVRKELFDGSPEEHISSIKILGNHNDLGKYFASIELHIVPVSRAYAGASAPEHKRILIREETFRRTFSQSHDGESSYAKTIMAVLRANRESVLKILNGDDHE